MSSYVNKEVFMGFILKSSWLFTEDFMVVKVVLNGE